MAIRDILGSAALHAGLILVVLAMPCANVAKPPKIYEVRLAVCAPRAAALPGNGAPSGPDRPPAASPASEAAKPSPVPPATAKPKRTATARKAVAKSIQAQKKPAPAESISAQGIGEGAASASPAATGLPTGSGGAGAAANGSAAYGADAVDERPSVLRRVEPSFPDQARRRHEEGTVLVRLIVDTQGQPKDCTVLRSEPAGLFDAAALEAVQRFRFRPGKLAGRAVATVVHIPFAFKLQ